MVLLSKIKRQINQFVTPEIEAIPDDQINFYPKTMDEENNHQQTPLSTPIPKPNHHKEKAYSHGLEALYTIETLDLKTLRPFGAIQETPSTVKKKKIYDEPLDPQMELSLGALHHTKIDSFLLNEPISVLDLPKNVADLLNAQNYRYLRDLLKINWNLFNFEHPQNKGIASELQDKLSNYFSGKQIHGCTTIDFESWIKSLIFGNETKFYLLLKEYHLSHLINLSPVMSVELKRLKAEDHHRLKMEAKESLQSTDRQELNNHHLKMTTYAFLNSWMQQKKGIAKEYELIDYLEQISENTTSFYSCLKFLSDVYNQGEFIFDKYLTCIYDKIYCNQKFLYFKFRETESLLLSYFPKRQERYLKNELISLVERELALYWDFFSDHFVERVLYTSPYFKFQRNLKYQVEVTLNIDTLLFSR